MSPYVSFDRILRIVRTHVTDEDVAQDLAQEVCIRAWRAAPDILPGREMAWVRRVVRNLSINASRDRARRRELLRIHGDILHPPPAPAPDLACRTGESERDLASVLERLPPAQAEVLRLRHAMDLSYAEIAERISAPMGTVMSRLHRAHGAVRAQFTLTRGDASPSSDVRPSPRRSPAPPRR